VTQYEPEKNKKPGPESREYSDDRTLSIPIAKRDPSIWKPGQRLPGEYCIDSILGRGGMGEVFRVHRESDDQVFAVKTLLEHRLDNTETRRQFYQELGTWIDLPDHPNITMCRFCRSMGNRKNYRNEKN